MKIGILAIQGDFFSHKKKLDELGVESVFVKKPLQLNEIQGLIIPGGESTTMSRIILDMHLLEPLKEFKEKRVPVFGTCAGIILMAKNIENDGKVISLGLLDVTVKRNAYGRQRESFEADVELKDGFIPGVFIRAPRIVGTGPEVEILGSLNGEPVLVKQDVFLGATFHPELTESTTVHEIFLEIVRKRFK